MSRCYNCMKEYQGRGNICPWCGYDQTSGPKELYYLSPGVVLANRYTVGVQINTGGFGIIYKAWDNTLDKMVAIKEYFPGGIANRIPGKKEVLVYSPKNMKEYQRGKEKFLNEARTVAKFNNHPNILDVYDFFEDNNTAYMIMDFLDGMSYKDYIRKKGGTDDVETAVNVTLCVLDALKVVHKAGILHRDINPSNIFICRTGEVKLIDFGASRIENTDMTRILTPHYAPPEQYTTKGKEGAYTDLYALGATLYTALTGVKPEESTDRQTEDHLKAPREIRPEIPEYVSNAVMRAMAVNPQLRYQNADQFKNALLNKGTVRDVEHELKHRKTVRIAGVLLIVLALAGAAGGGLWLTMNRLREVYLAEASIQVWVPALHGQTEEEARAMFHEMAQEYEEKYPQVQLEITSFEASEYPEVLKEAAEDGELPDVFDSTCLTEDELDGAASLTELEELLNREEYYLLEDYGEDFPDLKRVPLSIQLPVLYASSLNGQEAPEFFASCKELEKDGESNFSMNPEDTELYENMTGEDCFAVYEETAKRLGADPLNDGYELFIGGQTSFYLSDTSDYQRLAMDIPGQYQTILPDEDILMGKYDHFWSAGAGGTKNEQAAAQRLVYYLLSERAQDLFCVQNAGGIPLNRRMCQEYANVNSQDFSKITGWMEEITVE